MDEGVVDDVAHVLVAQFVAMLLADARGRDQPGGSEDLEVLGDGGLRDAERVDQLVDAPTAVRELADDADATWVRQRLQQRRSRLCRREAVLGPTSRVAIPIAAEGRGGHHERIVVFAYDDVNQVDADQVEVGRAAGAARIFGRRRPSRLTAP